MKNIRDVMSNLPLLQKKLKVGFTINGNQVSINGKEADVYSAEKVLEALDVGFPIDISLLLADPEYLLEFMNIKDFTRRGNLEDVRARIIGTQGKTKKLVEKLSGCSVKLKENTVYIVGHAEDIRETMTAIERLIRGSAQGKVYGFLERSRTQHKDEVVIYNDKEKEEKEKKVENKGNKKVKVAIIKKKKSSKELSESELAKGISHLKNSDEEGLEYED